MDKDKDKDFWLSVIYSALSGNITPAEQRMLDSWLAASADNRQLYAEVAELWAATGVLSATDGFDEAAGFRLFRERTRHHISNRPRASMTRWRHVAAAVLLVALSFYAAYQLWYPAPSISQPTKIVASKGSKVRTVLPDSTEVWLNADTELDVFPNFGSQERRVLLVGEAFFDVKEDADAPFIVETGALEVRVLGTAFNVSSYPGDSHISVNLVEGVVEIVPHAGGVFSMAANQTGYFDMTSTAFSLADGVEEASMSWREAKLIFKDKRFGDIVVDLQRLFDVDITVHSDELLERRFTGDFVNGEDVREILHVMSSIANFSYEITGRSIRIRK